MDLPKPVTVACQELEDDRLRGAHDLARRAVTAMAESLNVIETETVTTAELIDLLRTSAASLARVRPAISAIANAVAELFGRIAVTLDAKDEEGEGDQSPVQWAREVTSTFLVELARALARTAQRVPEVVSSESVVLTLSRSRTVLEGLDNARPQRVIVAESRPACEGRQAAEAFLAAGLTVELISDAALAGATAEASVVLVGADTILADGAVVNKMGTYGTALAAQAASVPVYVACETLKISPVHTMLTELHRGSELWKDAPEGVAVRNSYFELVQSDLITGIVTERGLLDATEATRVAAAKRQALQAIGVK